MKTENDRLVLNKNESWKMFDEISPKYDLLNRLLSFGLDIHWRNCLSKFVNKKDKIRVLDLATGTADVIITLFNKCRNIDSGVGMDLSEKMMEVGKKKLERLGLSERIYLEKGDANQIPFENDSFDNVSIAFGIRNVDEPAQVLREIYRVMNKDAIALILEFSLPKNKIMRMLHLFYLRSFVPCVGWLVSGHYKAYRYLNQTIEKFPYGEAFCQMMKNEGFSDVKAHPLLFGVATIYEGRKL